MKLTDDLKKKLETAQSKEEAEAILAEAKKAAGDAGVILDDEELDQVAGGSTDSSLWYCPECCKKVEPIYVSFGVYKCQQCGHNFYRHWWEFWK